MNIDINIEKLKAIMRLTDKPSQERIKLIWAYVDQIEHEAAKRKPGRK